MKFISLNISDSFSSARYNFQGVTVIHSDSNRVGKTTLVRCLLYALGYPIPSTRGLKFSRLHFELSIELDNGRTAILRRFDDRVMMRRENFPEEEYNLPHELAALLSKIFGIDSAPILNNLLGTFYLDQEKGWTLLNRGTVIGGIHFSIEDFLRGLSQRPCVNERCALKKVEHEIEKYKQLQTVADYKAKFGGNGECPSSDTKVDEIRNQIGYEINRRGALKTELDRVTRVIKQNSLFEQYIEEMRLRVYDNNGNKVLVTRDNIVGYDDTVQFMEARRSNLKAQLLGVEESIEKLQAQLPDVRELFQMESEAEKFERAIVNVRVDGNQVSAILDQLRKRQRELQKQLQMVLTLNNQIVSRLTESVRRYLIEFQVDERYGRNVFTNDLKSLSGATLHLCVAAFKFSYVKLVREVTGCKLPIILDSPNGKEVEKSVVARMLDTVIRDFIGHQLIIATIYDPRLEGQYVIPMKKGVLG